MNSFARPEETIDPVDRRSPDAGFQSAEFVVDDGKSQSAGGPSFCMADFQITVDDHELPAHWLDENDAARAELARAFPVSGDAARWGDELYFAVDLTLESEVLQREVDPGTVAYWPDGSAICLFWGPTPASTDDTPTAASPVAPIARVEELAPLRELVGGAQMRLDVRD